MSIAASFRIAHFALPIPHCTKKSHLSKQAALFDLDLENSNESNSMFGLKYVGQEVMTKVVTTTAWVVVVPVTVVNRSSHLSRVTVVKAV